jgi:hypothetical protein
VQEGNLNKQAEEQRAAERKEKPEQPEDFFETSEDPFAQHPTDFKRAMMSFILYRPIIQAPLDA